MPERFNKAWFTSDEFNLVVSRITPDQASKLAQPILRVLADAYERQYEKHLKLLPPGSSREHFSPDSMESVQKQQVRMRDYMSKNSEYWVAAIGRYRTTIDDIVGVAKTSPSRPTILHKAHLLKPNCYINDVAVSEPRKGIGSALLYTALSDYHPSFSSTVADVTPSSAPFFVGAGLRPVYPQPEHIEGPEIGGVDFGEEMTRYGIRFTGEIKYHLFDNNPWLADAVHSE